MPDASTIYIIKKESLKDPSIKIPEGIRRFISDFFEEKNILGIDCYATLDAGSQSPWAGMSGDNFSMKYEVGLTEKEKVEGGVFGWFKKQSEKHPDIVSECYLSYSPKRP